MNSFNKTLIGLFITAMLFGCSTPVPEQMTFVADSDPVLEQRTDAEPEVVEEEVPAFGKITLIRIEPEPTADEVLVYTNGTLLAVVGNFSYATMEFPRGNVVLTMDWDDTPLKFEEVIELDPSITPHKYLTISHKFHVPEISKKETSTDYTMEETLILFELAGAYATNVIGRLDPEFSYVFEPVD